MDHFALMPGVENKLQDVIQRVHCLCRKIVQYLDAQQGIEPLPFYRQSLPSSWPQSSLKQSEEEVKESSI